MIRKSVRQLLLGSVIATLVPAVNAAQDQPPKTPWGDPDLNGTWDYSNATPMERPDELGDKTHFTPEEAREFINGFAGLVEEESRAVEGDDFVGVELWVDMETVMLTRDLRTSLIYNPPNGKIPELTEAAKTRQDTAHSLAMRPPEGPEDRNPLERCIFGIAIPMYLSASYNTNVQIFQTPDTVAIMTEMINDTRIIPLDGHPHLPDNVRQWKGDSRGHWEGDTLVVETRNFTNKTSFNGSGMNMLLTERFTRINDTQIEYDYRIDDPDSFTAPWSVRQPIRKIEESIYEYACHEGNRSIALMLSGARTLEAEQLADDSAE